MNPSTGAAFRRRRSMDRAVPESQTRDDQCELSNQGLSRGFSDSDRRNREKSEGFEGGKGVKPSRVDQLRKN